MSTVRLVWDAVERMREDKSLPWQVRSRLEELQYYEEYADSDSPGGIVAANWNTVDKYNSDTGKREPIKGGDIMPRLWKLFEHYGLDMQWSDTVAGCSDCGKCIQTGPDCYSWKANYIIGDGETLCANCVADDPDKFLKEYEGTDKAWTLDNVDPADHGYVKQNADSYETGFHQGQTDDPKKIGKDLESKGVHRYIFVLDDNSQFYSRWSVYVHKDEVSLLKPKPSVTDRARATRRVPAVVSQEDYSDATENYMGFCTVCEAFTRDSTEPDAEGYDCPECENNTVVGAEDALISGLIEIE